MKSYQSVLVAVVSVIALATPARAQVPDHLKCYKVKDAQTKVSYTADLGGLVPEPGCTIQVPTRLACVPSTKTNVTPMPPGGGGSGTPNSFFCYKVKCPKVAILPTISGTDQFGSRIVAPRTATLLCAPLAGPTATFTTTTTTTSTSTTTTTLRFVDNGDGTVTDNQTGLQWEQKVSPGGGATDPHDVDNLYAWGDLAGCPFAGCPNGTAFTDFLGRLNNCTSSDGTAVTNAGFAGHCDWRLPTMAELRSILDCNFFPCIDPIFGPTATATSYWSGITLDGFPSGAWGLGFSGGSPTLSDKQLGSYVRAVRGGS